MHVHGMLIFFGVINNVLWRHKKSAIYRHLIKGYSRLLLFNKDGPYHVIYVTFFSRVVTFIDCNCTLPTFE